MRSRAYVVIVGAGYAGLMAALRLSRRTRRDPIDITLINESAEFVERIRLHQRIVGHPARRWPLHELLKGSRVRLLHGRVVDLDSEDQRLVVHGADGTQRVPFDHLLLALGSRATRPMQSEGAELYAVGDVSDAKRLVDRLPEVATIRGSVAVVGGGSTGIEVAAELAEAFPQLQVTLLTAGRVGSGLSERAREHIRRTLAGMRVSVREGAPVRAVERGTVILDNGEHVDTDLCIWAGPLRAPTLAADAGLPVNDAGQMLVDAHLRSIAAPNIFAAGDAAAVTLSHGGAVRMACATALPLGAHAAECMAATLTRRPLRPFRFAYAMQCLSLGRSNGVIQRVRNDDTPTDWILTGRPAAWVKERVSRSTMMALRMERRGLGYRWPQGKD